MHVLHSCQPPFASVFLAGPTPRDADTPSWRPQAVELLRSLGFQGTVLVPERESRTSFDYDDQVEWEFAGLSQATRIAFWVPRDLKTMPALTTNVEFGYWLAQSPDRVRYGRPNGAPRTSYLDWLYTKTTGRVPTNDLAHLLQECL